ncbi:MAG: hypothetical protein ABJC89_19805 [Acidobacteriota bacterium]
MAAPVLRAPSERVFGMEIVGRHHDPFTVMQQFARPIRLGVYSQPVTDLAGALLARVSGPVAAYNWLILLSFPLSAAAAYLLARHLALSPSGAAVAAMAFAFSPFHLAHAAYHPHIAQTQWLPLYLLALWHCLDNPSLASVVFLGGAGAAVTLSNFYGGLIAGVITPAAVGAYWLLPRATDTRSLRRLGITCGALLVIAIGFGIYEVFAVGAFVPNQPAYVFPRADLFLYSAKWWSYLVPPAEHPVLGPSILRFWLSVGVREGLLEQQVGLGLGIVALALVAVAAWTRRHRHSSVPPLPFVPVLVAVALAALLCSLSPERTTGTFTFVRPSALLFTIAPMFRSYARFGVVAQLIAALLAGIGVDWLRGTGSRLALVTCLALVALAAAEYAVSPAALWRDVLPTAAHRWVMQQGDGVRVLDCTRLTPQSESVPWLTAERITLLGGPIATCTDARLPQRLAVNGYTHLLVRRDSFDRRAFAGDVAPDGLRLAASFDDAAVFAVTADKPAVYTARMSGFFPLEHDAGWTWRWMGTDALWTIVNTADQAMTATLRIELSAFDAPRRMNVLLDGRLVRTLIVAPARASYDLASIAVTPGTHDLLFHPVDAPAVAGSVTGNGDPRALSFAFGAADWIVERR